MKYTQIQEQMNTNFEQEKMQLKQKFEDSLQLKEKELSEVKVELLQKTATIAKHFEENIHQESELQSTLTKLGETEKRCETLQQQNIQLSNEAITTVQRFDGEMKKKQSKIDELNIHIKSIKTSENNFLSELEALKETNKQLVTDRAKQDANARQALNEFENQMTEQKKLYNELEQQHLNITKELTVEKTVLNQQLEDFRETQEKNMSEFQEMLDQKEADLIALKKKYADLEREKNSEITQLNYKMNQIGIVFSQSVATAEPVIKDQNKGQITANKTAHRSQSVASVNAAETSGKSVTKISAAIAPSASTSVAPRAVAAANPAVNRRKLVKRPVYRVNNSDFNTDTDDNDQQTEWQPPQKKYVALHKRERRDSSENNNDLFDALKKSSN
ncbi:uncharacterized protein MCAP_0864 [Drosophila innubila]|uniref:uncharacterized protein MCAP_0864 n=1 Tax=Drosophila innubila TaxID=198719 RepID=UPI00148E3210|nr:uncharacterized protein MCAP_0864 [Drosophila innubila]